MAKTFRANGFVYDGQSWKVQLPDPLHFERIFEEMLSFDCDTTVNAQHREGTSDESTGTNMGKGMPMNMKMGMYKETWLDLRKRLVSISPDPERFSLAVFDFSIQLRALGFRGQPAREDLIEVFDARFLSDPIGLKHDAQNIPVDITMIARKVLINGARP